MQRRRIVCRDRPNASGWQAPVPQLDAYANPLDRADPQEVVKLVAQPILTTFDGGNLDIRVGGQATKTYDLCRQFQPMRAVASGRPSRDPRWLAPLVRVTISRLCAGRRCGPATQHKGTLHGHTRYDGSYKTRPWSGPGAYRIDPTHPSIACDPCTVSTRCLRACLPTQHIQPV